MSNKRIGIFGGTFNPPHFGHLILASEAHEQLNLTQLLWMLTPQSPLKNSSSISLLEHRMEMVKIAIADNPLFQLSLAELDRPAPYYTLDTLKIIQNRNPKADLVLLIGGDSLEELPHWHGPSDLVNTCHEIGVMRRPGTSIDLSALEITIPGLSQKIRYVETPLLEISSSEIRSRVSEGRSIRYFLPEKVHEYIRQHSLYQ